MSAVLAMTATENANRVIRERSGKRGAALMLLWLLAETHGGEALPIPEIAEIVGCSERHIKRLIEQCEADGDLKVTRGQGRGHRSIYHVTYLLKGDTSPFRAAPCANKTKEIKGDIKGDTSPKIKGDIAANVSPFPAEIKGDIAQPPHTPHKDNNILNTNSSFANAQEETPSPKGSASRRRMESAISKLSADERAVLEAWRELTKAYPPEPAWETITGRLKTGFDRVRFKRCGGAYLAYNGKGQRHVGGILDWYDEDRTEPRANERNGNGTSAQTTNYGKPAVTRDFSKYPARP